MQQADQEFQFLEKFSKALDNKYKVPGTRFKFGLDPIIGLVPGIGDSITFLISSGLVVLMVRHGISGKVAVKMIANVLLDTIIGAIPIIGQIFDFFYKANARNVRLLKEHYEEGKYQGSGIGIIIAIILAIMIIFILLVYAITQFLVWFFGLF